MPRGYRTARRLFAAAVAAIGVALAVAPASADDDTDRALAAIKAVGREGKGNDTAGLAWKTVVARGAPALFPTLTAIDDANPTAANWLRAAVGAIAEKEKEAGRPLPAARLEAFLKDAKFAPSARRVAYELLIAQDPAAKDRVLPGFLSDPSPDLRRDAVAAELDKLGKTPGPDAKPQLQKLFAAARDTDQVEDIARKLEDVKVRVSVTEHLGFVTHWHVVGPFDSAEGKALTLSYPPETKVALGEKYKGKDGAEAAWTFHAATEIRKDPMTGQKEYALVDLNKAVGKHKNVAAYAAALVTVEKDTPAEVRVTTPNAVQIFLDGKKVYEREEYHHGAPPDSNVGRCVLKAGRNTLVIKVCQNDEKPDYAQVWQFQARVCDPTGGPIPNAKQLVPEKDQLRPIALGHVPEAAEKKEEKK
jgi:hypothetical protein